jgi:sugar fermentation stimulation protein A
MQFAKPFTKAILLRRYRRYLVQAMVTPQQHCTLFCPNIGELNKLDQLGTKIWFSSSDNPRSKYPYTWEMMESANGLIDINLERAIPLVKEAINLGNIAPLKDYRLVANMQPNIDVTLNGTNSHRTDQDIPCYLQVNSVLMGDEIQRGFVPEQPSPEAVKKLAQLKTLKAQGARVILFYVVQHTGIDRVFPADHIDPFYGAMLREIIHHGVEVLAYKAHISPENITLTKPVEVCIPKRKTKISN